MTLTIHEDLEQGSQEWLDARCGLLTASTIGQLITSKTVKPAQNEASRSLVRSLVAERITRHVEPTRESEDMLRGTLDEPYARDVYSAHHAHASECGLMVRVFPGVKLGYSPDGLVGDDGLIEIKSRRQKKHLDTILSGEVPSENMAQIQAGLLVSGRDWCDYISYCGGMPLWTKRVTPDERWHEAIIDAAAQLEETAEAMISQYQSRVRGLPVTERIDHWGEEPILI